MTTSTKAMMAKVKQLVPPMLEKFHKGSFSNETLRNRSELNVVM
jgi:hypothetical protein